MPNVSCAFACAEFRSAYARAHTPVPIKRTTHAMLVTLSARFGRRVRVTTGGTHARAVSSATASIPSPVDIRTRATFYDPAVEASLTHRQRQVFAKPSDAPPLPAVADHGYQYGVTPAEVEGRGACVARALSTRPAGGQGALQFNVVSTSLTAVNVTAGSLIVGASANLPNARLTLAAVPSHHRCTLPEQERKKFDAGAWGTDPFFS